MKLFIDGRRDGYAPSQCYKTITVGEMIDILSEYDEDMEIYLKNDNGYTYGSIDYDSFSVEEVEE